MPDIPHDLIIAAGATLVGVVAFFLARLINQNDNFQRGVIDELGKLNTTLTRIEIDLREQIGDCETRLSVLEEAGCKRHRACQ